MPADTHSPADLGPGERPATAPDAHAAVTSPERLAALGDTGLLAAAHDADARAAFDRLGRLTTRLLGVSTALVSLVDVDRQVFVGCVGLPGPAGDARETPLSHSLCQYVVADRAPVLIEDARIDPRAAAGIPGHGAVQDLGVVAYAGVPLVTSDGQVLGALCAIDGVPRCWSDDDVACLRDLSVAVMTEIECRAKERRSRTLARDLTVRERQQRVLLALADALRPLVDPVAMQALAAERLGATLGAARAYYAEVDAGAGTIHIARDYVRTGVPSIAGTLPLAAFDWIGPAFTTGEVVAADDVRTTPVVPEAQRAALLGIGVGAFVAAPLVRDGQPVAVLSVTDTTPRAWTAEEIALVEETAARTWEAISRARAEESLEDARRRLDAALLAGEVGIFQWAIAENRLWGDANFARLFGVTLDTTGAAPIEAYLDALAPEDAERVGALVQHAVDTGAPYEAEYRVRGGPAARGHEDFAPGAPPRWVQARGRVEYAPDGRPLRFTGVVQDVTRRRTAEIEREQAAVALREQVAVAQAARAEADTAHEAADVARSRTSLLQGLTAALAGARTLDAVAAVVVERIAGAIGARTGALAIPTPDGSALVQLRTVGFSPGLADQLARQPLIGAEHPTPAAHAFLSRRPVWIEHRDRRSGFDVQQPALAPHLDALVIGAAAVVPLLFGEDEAVGTISFAFTDPRQFSEADRTFLLAVGRQAALAIDRVRAAAALSGSEAKYRVLFERMDQGFCLVEVLFAEPAAGAQPVDYRFLETNPAFIAQTGLTHAIGRRMRELAPAHEAFWFETYGRVAVTGDPVRFDHQAAALGRWYEVYAFRVGVPEQRRVAVLFTDVTAARTAAAEQARLFAASERDRVAAQEARAAAERANQTKATFLATMSHELRTPLNAIGGYAELIELGIHGPVTPQQLEALGRVQRAQRHLLGLINGVLDYAKIDAGKVHYTIADVLLGEVLHTCEALVAPQARAKGLALRYDVVPPDLLLRADREKLQQIVLNLLSNAVKFTEAGGRVTLAGGTRDGIVCITVVDTGVGIPAEQLAQVFDPFVQVDTAYTRTQQGTGLGLAISRDLARGMGGDLTAESTPGVGSTFTLTLPAA